MCIHRSLLGQMEGESLWAMHKQLFIFSWASFNPMLAVIFWTRIVFELNKYCIKGVKASQPS